MWQMVKRDFYINWVYIVLIFLFPFFIRLFRFTEPGLFTYFMIFFSMFAMTFYSDEKNAVNRTIVSLPIKKCEIILARYLFFSIISTIYIIYLWGIDHTIFNQFKTPASTTFTGEIVLVTFAGTFVAIAVSLPIYYIIEKFWISALIQFIVLFFGSAILFLIFLVTSAFSFLITSIMKGVNTAKSSGKTGQEAVG